MVGQASRLTWRAGRARRAAVPRAGGSGAVVVGHYTRGRSSLLDPWVTSPRPPWRPTQPLRAQMAVAHRAPPMQNPEPVDRIQRFLPGPPSPIRPEPTTVGRRPTAPCTRAPPPCVAKNGARMPTESYMEARCESRGVVGAARMVWEDRACTAAPRQPSLSQTNRCLLRALRTAGRGLLCPVPSDTPCPAPAACSGASRALLCQDAGGKA